MSWETASEEPVSATLWWFLPTTAGTGNIYTHVSLTRILQVSLLHQYFILILSFSLSPDGQPTLLPPVHVLELNLRSTRMLNNIQRFFSHHMIETYGCDYSTSGLSLEALQAKLRIFMEAHTADGPRHDTYVLYYSGHTHRSGEWALAGGRIIT